MIIFSLVLIAVIQIISIILTIKVMLSFEKRISSLESFGFDNDNNVDIASPEPNINNINNIEKSVANGLFLGMKRFQEESHNQLKLLDLARKAQSFPTSIYSNSNNSSVSYDTGGELIPDNLSKEEQDILQVWYSKEDKE